MLDDASFHQKLVGECLRRARQERGFSLRHLAAESKVSASQILRIESGEFDIRLSTLLKVATCLGVPAGLTLEQGLMISPGFYAKRVGELGVTSLGKLPEIDSRARSRLIVFLSQCAVAIAYLLRSSNPPKIATTFSFPFSELESEIKRLAHTIDSLDFADRLAFMRDLAEEPLEVLIREKIARLRIVEKFLVAAESREHPFSGIPDFFRLLS